MNNKVGFIGLGSMGSMLVKGFLSKNALDEQDIFISTYTKSKLNDYKKIYPRINTANDNSDLASHCNYIFICVKPLQVKSILNEIKNNIVENTHIITITGCVTLENISTVHDGMVSKVLPTVLSEIKTGVSLVCHNKKVSNANKAFIENLFKSIGKIKIISESDFELGGDLTSCAPGLFAAMFSEYIKSAKNHQSNFSEQDMVDMVIETLYGTAKMLRDYDMSFDEIIDRVARKGGITEEGIKLLRNNLPKTFGEVFNATLNKHIAVKEQIVKLFDE